ncbi:MAG: hypothetical protein K9J13_00140 [Saprospiraceae bacterium]|nr:hypothetical protein [Saprospiraceae bacterium]
MTEVAICGYSYDHSGIQTGVLRLDSTFIGVGFIIFSCQDSSDIFSDGEYYTDSVKLHSNSIEIFKTSWFSLYTFENSVRVPMISIHLLERNGAIHIDSTFAFPVNEISISQLQKIEKELVDIKSDPERSNDYPIFRMEYLFMKAIHDPEKYSADFLSIGSLDGYMGRIYRDYRKYFTLYLKEKTECNK